MYNKCYAHDSIFAKFAQDAADFEKTLAAFLCAIPTAKEEAHMFTRLMNARSEILEFSEIERFIEGFRLGARFMLDTFLIPHKSAIRDIN